jgi:hypothetical protein
MHQRWVLTHRMTRLRRLTMKHDGGPGFRNSTCSRTRRTVRAHSTGRSGASGALTSGRGDTRAHRFVAQVVAPQLGGSTAVYYQLKPSLRVQPPGAHGIRFHTDREYHHQVRARQ